MTKNYPIMVAGLCPDLWRNRITRVVNSGSRGQGTTQIIQQSCSAGDPNKIINGIFVPTIAIPSAGSYGTQFNRDLEGDSAMNSSGATTQNNQGHSHFSATSIRELGKRYYYYYTVENARII